MIYFTAHTFKCVCHCRRAMFRVLSMYNFAYTLKDIFRLPNTYIRGIKKKQGKVRSGKRKVFFFNEKTKYFGLKKYKFQSKTLKYSTWKKETILIRKKKLFQYIEKMIIPSIELKLRIEQKID